jgi:hypothetical protein
MKVTTIQKIHQIKQSFLKGWYFCMKPLAKVLLALEEKRAKKRDIFLQQMSLEMTAQLFVKYTAKQMAKQKNPKQIYYCCTKKEGYSEYYEDNFILAELSSFGYSRFSKTKIGGWYFRNQAATAIGYGDGSKERWMALENQLRPLIANAFIKKGCIVTYQDETEKLDAWFIKQSGYEKSMIVTIE